VAHEALALNRLENSVSLRTMLNILAQEFVNRFLVRGREINTSEVDRLLNWLGKAAVRKCSPKVHLVPCHLMYEMEPEVLRVGPVVFHTRRSFYKRVKGDLRSYRRTHTEPGTRGLLKDALYYYRGFKWVAEVPVVAADEQTSIKIAMEATRAALNGLNTAFGASDTDKMQVGGPRLTLDRRGHLHIAETGDFNVTVSITGPDQVGFAKGWSRQLLS
jgi:hypothetical protein